MSFCLENQALDLRQSLSLSLSLSLSVRVAMQVEAPHTCAYYAAVQKNSPDCMKLLPQAIDYSTIIKTIITRLILACVNNKMTKSRISFWQASFNHFFNISLILKCLWDSASRLFLFVMLRSSTWHRLIQLKTITPDLDILFSSLFLSELLTSTLGCVWKSESRALS